MNNRSRWLASSDRDRGARSPGSEVLQARNGAPLSRLGRLVAGRIGQGGRRARRNASVAALARRRHQGAERRRGRGQGRAGGDLHAVQRQKVFRRGLPLLLAFLGCLTSEKKIWNELLKVFKRIWSIFCRIICCSSCFRRLAYVKFAGF